MIEKHHNKDLISEEAMKEKTKPGADGWNGISESTKAVQMTYFGSEWALLLDKVCVISR